jgi:putative endonuclease
MTSYVYVLATELGDGRKTYVGWTTDLDRRLKQHNTGRGAKSTRGRLWLLVYVEKYSTRSEAMSREWALKHDKSFRARLRAF